MFSIQQWKALKEKTNEELFSLHQENRRTEIRQGLALRYLYIVKAVAVQTYNTYSDFIRMEDIINEGVIVITKDIDRFNSDGDNNLETYIARRAEEMAVDLVRKSDNMLRDHRKQNRAIENARMQLADKLGRRLSDEETADHLSMKVRKYKKIQRISTMINVLSLDMVTNEEHQSFRVASENIRTQLEQAFLQEKALQTLTDAINNLGEKERVVTSLCYVERPDMTQIAGVLQVSEPRILQIHNAAIRELKTYMNRHLQQEEDIMCQGFYNFASSMLTQNRNLDVIGNSMINIQTLGYKNDTMTASTFSEELLYRTGRHYKENTAPLATASKISITSRIYVDYGQGSFGQTDGIYDFALDNKRFSCIQIQNGERYTGNDSLAASDQGYLMLPGIGRVISAGNQPIQIDSRDFRANESDTISVLIITGGDDGNSEMEVEKRTYGTLKVADFTGYEQLHKEDNGMISTAQAPIQATEDGERTQILWKTLEKSNIDMVKETAAMMSSQRALQSAVQTLKMYDQIMSKSAADIGRL